MLSKKDKLINSDDIFVGYQNNVMVNMSLDNLYKDKFFTVFCGPQNNRKRIFISATKPKYITLNRFNSKEEKDIFINIITLNRNMIKQYLSISEIPDYTKL